ncbi:phosphate starvation-inducible PhoH-like protein [Desulfitispora alkaliphila]|uniref:PhoH family protein n=1 Tax=Desulfitispora alkaliphila TaxID=622674 RepID=UPI003D1E6807
MEKGRNTITLKDNYEASNIFGKYDENLKIIEQNVNAKIIARGLELIVSGTEQDVEKVKSIIDHLRKLSNKGIQLTPAEVNYAVKEVAGTENERNEVTSELSKVIILTHQGKQIMPKTLGQANYLKAIQNYDVVFGIGPAGTGKTYLAVVKAVAALKEKRVNRIILARPAVEAGEKLGFLPGDLQEKVNPYLRPLYDGLYDILGAETAQKYMEKNIIEVAPLAYMRGRTLNDSFIILDEAQNTTPEQMKMLLTRIGFGSKAVITGDITQVDLPKGQYSGLIEVQKVLKNVEGISFCYLTAADVVRHPLVQKIVTAYDDFDSSK